MSETKQLPTDTGALTEKEKGEYLDELKKLTAPAKIIINVDVKQLEDVLDNHTNLDHKGSLIEKIYEVNDLVETVRYELLLETEEHEYSYRKVFLLDDIQKGNEYYPCFIQLMRTKIIDGDVDKYIIIVDEQVFNTVNQNNNWPQGWKVMPILERDYKDTSWRKEKGRDFGAMDYHNYKGDAYKFPVQFETSHGDNVVTGSWFQFEFEAQVNENNSDRAINNGRVVKLAIWETGWMDEPSMIYDNAWVKESATEAEKKIFAAILEQLEEMPQELIDDCSVL